VAAAAAGVGVAAAASGEAGLVAAATAFEVAQHRWDFFGWELELCPGRREPADTDGKPLEGYRCC
jgi:hypothetical protein